MTWHDELRKMLAQAGGDVGLFCALVALRKAENGGTGREFGVLSTNAPTYRDQLRVAANSLKHARIRAINKEILTIDEYGFYTEGFLKDFSTDWAPIGVENDPKNLNSNFSRNMVKLNADYKGRMLECMLSMDG